MDSSSSSLTSAGEATEALKSLLKVGKPIELHSSSEAGHSFNGRAQEQESLDLSRSQASNVSNGEIPIVELLKMAQQQGPAKQQVLLTGTDVQNSFSVYSSDVNIISSERSSSPMLSAGSNKVKTSSIVNFDWEHKLYYGNLVAVHKNGQHVAYVLKGKSGGVVRVINTQTTERALLKGFSGRIMDISFAHISTIVLGAVDEMGNMAIYEILEESTGKIVTELILHIVRPADSEPDLEHRLIWCPYLPEDDESSTDTGTDCGNMDDAGKLLVLTHGKLAEMWNIDMVTNEYEQTSMLPDDVEVGYLVINNHTEAIVDACYSPDGSALATASLDGYVKFFQVYLHDKNPPRCIHQWKPHDGSPVTSLFFLDDQKNPNPDVQFWKFAVTGADNNQEIKIWACETWACLQTLKFLPNPSVLSAGFAPQPCIKAALDLSANYLILSDINRKVLYVLQLFRDSDSSRAHVSSISEFLLTQPCLSLAIVDASRKKFRKLADSLNHLGDLTSGEVGQIEDVEILDSHTVEIGATVRLFSVHTKVLQELQIKFKPESSVPQPAPSSISSVSQSELAMRDHLSDISMESSLSERDIIARAYTERSRSYDEQQLSSGASSRSFEGQNLGASSRSFDGIRGESRPGSGGSSSGIGAIQGKPPAPTLIPPDAYTTSSPRKEPRDSSIALDSARSSATVQSNMSNISDLTQVTAMEDDALRSARGSLMTSQQDVTSPQSSVTMTPASSRDLSTSSQFAHTVEGDTLDKTPSSVPLPPPTPGEDSALVTPPAYRTNQPVGLGSSGMDQLAENGSGSGMFGSPRITTQKSVESTPRTSHQTLEGQSQQPHLGMNLVQDFMTSSPLRSNRDEFNPPMVNSSQDDAEEISVVAPVASAEEFYETVQNASATDVVVNGQRAKKLGSANSSSSTSLEVSEIMEGAKKPDAYINENEEDDDDERDDEEEDEEGEEEGPSPSEQPQIHESDEKAMEESVAEEIEEVIEIEEESEDERDSTDKQANTSGLLYDTKTWPAPPEVADEAKRLASEALHRASTYTVENGSQMYIEQADGDVQVEEEQEEDVNEGGANQNQTEAEMEVFEDKPQRQCQLSNDLDDNGSNKNARISALAHFSIGDDILHEGASVDIDGSDGVPRKANIAKERVVDNRKLPKNDPSLDDLSYSTSMSSPSRLIPNKESLTAISACGEPDVYGAAQNSSQVQVERIEQLQTSVQQMIALLQTQQKEIEHLRDEINQNRSAQETLKGLQSQIDNLEGLLTSKVTETLAKHSSTESERLQQVLGQRESHDQQKHDNLISTVTQTLERTISNKLERIVKDEIRSHVLPKITEVIQPIKQDLHKEVSQKLTATDSLVKENIAKLIRSRQTVEAMGTAAGNALQGPVQGACKDVLIPAFDRACNNMFQQINVNFQRGTQEYTKQLESHMEQVRRRHDQSRDPVIQQLGGMADTLRAHEQAVAPTHAELKNLSLALQAQLQHQSEQQRSMETAVHQAVHGLQENLVREVKRLIENEVVTAVKDQQTTISTQLIDAMRSGMVTPVPSNHSMSSPDPEHLKTQVLTLLRQGQVNNAFQTALSASDLSLVMFVCETVNPSQIFNQTPCPLQQPVLLSLIQQLSADLGKQVDLKLKYLEEAVMNLDRTNTVVQEHIPAVLGQLSQKITMFIQSNPTDPRTRGFKMLLMASRSMMS